MATCIAHGGESRDLNDRVHGIRAGIRTKQVNKLIILFLIRDIPEDHNTLRERDIRFNRK